MVLRKFLILLSFNGLVVSLDQLTKNIVANSFKLGASKEIFATWFSITRIHNPGAAFGLLASLPPPFREPFFFLVPTLTLLFILALFFRLKEEQTLTIYALSLIVGGAFGNLADRIRLGFVIDFFDLHFKHKWHFPAFNIADMAITLGVALLLVGMLQERDSEHQPRRDS